MTRLNSNSHLSVESNQRGAAPLLFEMQPIVNSFNEKATGYECLFRGAHPDNWTVIDAALLAYLAQPRHLPLLFVNLSNHGLLAHAVAEFVQASKANEVIFEISESVTEYAQREGIAVKVNELIKSGVRVAVDDFGAGRDSLERLYSLAQPTAVKIDRDFLLTCMRREDARSTLCHLIEQWKANGIVSIAEGVETAGILDFARMIGVDLMQGWHVDAIVANARPVRSFARSERFGRAPSASGPATFQRPRCPTGRPSSSQE